MFQIKSSVHPGSALLRRCRWPLLPAAALLAPLLAVSAACGGSGGSPAPAAGGGAPVEAATPGSMPVTPAAPRAGDQAVAYASMAKAALGHGASLNGAVPFPADNPWNTDIRSLPVDPNSDNLIASIGVARGLFPDFGSGTYNGAPIGIPYTIVPGTQPKVAIHFTQPWDENDPGPYPIPADAHVEGENPAAPGSGGDRHVLVIDKDNHRLYELYRAFRNDDGSWNAESAALFHLDSNNVRPGGQPGWTSADAAGLPIFPGLVRYDEAAGGRIAHALRFTASRSRRAYVPPATHMASNSADPDLPPMGMRVRLKADYVIPDSASAPTRAILRALKTYGMILADNGSDWFISGAPDARWNNATLKAELGRVKGADLEVVRMDGLVTP